MQVVSSTPFRVATLVWQPAAGRFVLSVLCKATFSLRPGVSPLAPDQEVLQKDDAFWGNDMNRSLSRASDLSPLKPRVDVVLTGHAFAPNRAPVQRLTARLAVGEVDKSIEVVGQRYYDANGALREGPPFAQMPMVYELSAAGPENPAGMRPGTHSANGLMELPNLVAPSAQAGHRNDAFAPIGFGPIASIWPMRMEKLGRLGATWDHGKWYRQPLEGIDMAFFNCAPPDQQLTTLRDDERIVLENLHPEHPVLVTCLPGIRPVVTVEVPDRAPFPLALAPDTLAINTAALTLSVVWRGHFDVADPRAEGRVVIQMETGAPKATRAPSAGGRGPDAERAASAGGHSPDAARDMLGETALPSAEPTEPALPFHAGVPGAPPSIPSSPEPRKPRRSGDTMSIPVYPSTPTAPVSVSVEQATPLGGPSSRSGAKTGAFPSYPDTSTSQAPFGPPSQSFGPPSPSPFSAPSSQSPFGPPSQSPFAAPPSQSPFASPVPAPKTEPPPPIAQPVSQPPIPPPFAPPIVTPRADLPLEAPAVPLTIGQALAAAHASGGADKTPVASGPREPEMLATPVKEDDGSARVAAEVSAGGVLAASNAAVPPPPITNPFASAGPAPEGESPRAVVTGGAEVLRLAWLDANGVPRLRRKPAFRAILDELAKRQPDRDADNAHIDETPAEIEDRREVTEILLRGAPVSEGGVRDALNEGIRDDGRFVPQAVLCAGELEMAFDAVETLKAMLPVAASLATPGDALSAAVAGATTFLNTPGIPSPVVADALAGRVRSAFLQGKKGKDKAEPLDGPTERVLVEQRLYRRRPVFGDVFVRASLFLPGSPYPIPVYFPEAAVKKLPLFRRYRARLLGEVHLTADPSETHPVALRATALAEVLPGGKR